MNRGLYRGFTIATSVVLMLLVSVPVAADNSTSTASTLPTGVSYHYVCWDDACTYGIDREDYMKFSVYEGDRYKVVAENPCSIDYAAASITLYTGSSWGTQYRLDCYEEITFGYYTASSAGYRYVHLYAHDDSTDDQNKIKITLTIDTTNRDRDGDGYKDSVDDCDNDYGDSYQDYVGCPDYDGDGWADFNDDCEYDSSEHVDTDGDSFCDGEDEFPNDYTQWVDDDDDGYGDNAGGNQGDHFPSDSTQWFDNDGDGWGDNSDGNNPDHCRFVEGYSYEDRNGCPDGDWDGWSDPDSASQAHPEGTADAFPHDSGEWHDTDEDNYGDNSDQCPSAAGTSAFKLITSSQTSKVGTLAVEIYIWPHSVAQLLAEELYSDLDDLDEEFLLEGEWEYAVSVGVGSKLYWTPWLGCDDSDGDGFEDGTDRFVNDPTQWADSDSDGYGDNLAHPSISQFNPDSCRNSVRAAIEGGFSGWDRGFEAIMCVAWGAGNDFIHLESEEFVCENGDDIIPLGWVNDGEEDCSDGSDEGVEDFYTSFKPSSRYYHFQDYDVGWAIPGALNGDDCPLQPGTSTLDRLGCLDSDGDGWSDPDESWTVQDGADRFKDDATQYIDTDGDGYGDNTEGERADVWPDDPSIWSDSDGDGWADQQGNNKSDLFSNDSTQWADRDGDGYGENASGIEPDDCTRIYGESTIDRFGCPDSNGDGYSDKNGFLATTLAKGSGGDVGSILILSILPMLLVAVLIISIMMRKNKNEDSSTLEDTVWETTSYSSNESGTTPSAPQQSMMQSPPPSVSSDWVEQNDPEGNTYYYNPSTQESRWDKP